MIILPVKPFSTQPFLKFADNMGMVNLDPTFMFRLMRDLLAASYGKPLFQHRGTTPVSDLARPKVDSYIHAAGLQSNRDIICNPVADGIVASLVKNAVVMVAGASDTFGPLPMAVLESPQNPRPLIRITKDFLGDLANGLLSIGAQLSFYSKYGTPGESTYAKTIVWTDLGIAAASYIFLGSALSRPRTSTPQPNLPPLFIQGPELVCASAIRTYETAVGISIDASRVPPHILLMAGKPRVDNDRLAEVLSRHNGNQTRAAKELGMDSSSISERIRRAPEGSPLKAFRNKWVSDADLIAALQATDGNQTLAADKLGIEPSIISGRVNRAAETSPLAHYRRATIDVDALAIALDKHDGNQSAAAAELGIGISTISRYVNNAAPRSKLAQFKVPSRRTSANRFTEQELIVALDDNGRDARGAVKGAAADLDVSAAAVSMRRKLNRITDERIVQLMTDYNNVLEVAHVLRIPPKRLLTLIRNRPGLQGKVTIPLQKKPQ